MLLIDEMKELLYRAYVECFDLRIAQKLTCMSDATFEKIIKDKEFLERIAIVDATEQARIVRVLIELSKSLDESIQLRAIMNLGKIYYKRKFKIDNKSEEDDSEENNSIPDKILLLGSIE